MKEGIKIIFTIFLALAAAVFFIQGFTQYEFIPVSIGAFVFGVGSSSFSSFFIYPFAFIIIRFLILFVTMPFAARQGESRAIKIGLKFWIFLTDFFRWGMALWFSMTLSGMMVIAGLIPNEDPPLFNIMINFYLGFFILLLVLRRIIKGDFFDEVIRLFSNFDNNRMKEQQKKDIGKVLLKKFLIYFFMILFSLVLLFVFLMFIAPILYSFQNGNNPEITDLNVSFFEEASCPKEYSENLTFFVPNQEISLKEGDFRYIKKIGGAYCDYMRIRLNLITSVGTVRDLEGNVESEEFGAVFYIEGSQQYFDSFMLQEGQNSSLVSQTWGINETLEVISINNSEENKSVLVRVYNS